MQRNVDGSHRPGGPGDVLGFLAPVDRGLDDLVLAAAAVEGLRDLCLRAPMGGLAAVVTGPPGVGKTIATRACAGHLRLDTWLVDCAGLVRLHGTATTSVLPDVLAAGDRPHAVMLFHDAGWLFDRAAGGAGAALLRLAPRRKPPTVLESREPLTIPAGIVPTPIAIEIPRPGRAEREELWRRLAWRVHPLLDLDVARLAEVDAPGAAIERALEGAVGTSAGGAPDVDDLLRRLRAPAP